MTTLKISRDVFQTHANADVLKLRAETASKDLVDFLSKLTQAANHSDTPPYSVFQTREMLLPDDHSTKGVFDFTLLHAHKDYDLVMPEQTERLQSDAETSEENAHEQNDMASPPLLAASPAPANSPHAPQMEFSNSVTGNEHSKMFIAPDADTAPSESKRSDYVSLPEQGPPQRIAKTTETNILDFSFGVRKIDDHSLAPVVQMRFDTQARQQDGAPIFVRDFKPDQILHIDELPRVANFIYDWVHSKMPEKDKPAFEQKCIELGLIEQNNPSIGFGAHLKDHPALETQH